MSASCQGGFPKNSNGRTRRGERTTQTAGKKDCSAPQPYPRNGVWCVVRNTHPHLAGRACVSGTAQISPPDPFRSAFTASPAPIPLSIPPASPPTNAPFPLAAGAAGGGGPALNGMFPLAVNTGSSRVAALGRPCACAGEFCATGFCGPVAVGAGAVLEDAVEASSTSALGGSHCSCTGPRCSPRPPVAGGIWGVTLWNVSGIWFAWAGGAGAGGGGGGVSGRGGDFLCSRAPRDGGACRCEESSGCTGAGGGCGRREGWTRSIGFGPEGGWRVGESSGEEVLEVEMCGERSCADCICSRRAVASG